MQTYFIRVVCKSESVTLGATMGANMPRMLTIYITQYSERPPRSKKEWKNDGLPAGWSCRQTRATPGLAGGLVRNGPESGQPRGPPNPTRPAPRRRRSSVCDVCVSVFCLHRIPLKCIQMGVSGVKIVRITASTAVKGLVALSTRTGDLKVN